MKPILVKSFSLLILGIFALTGCVRQPGASVDAKLEELPGVYRVLWSDGTPNDHNFTIENKNGDWYMSDEEQSQPLQKMTQADIETRFGKEMAGKAQCLQTMGGASTIILCAGEPGVKTSVKVDDFVSYSKDFTTKTNHFVFIDYMGIWDMEKLK